MHPSEKGVGGKYQKSTISMRTWFSFAKVAEKAFNVRSMLLSVSSTGWRKSTVRKTLPGITFRELGLTSICPTVAQA